MKFEPEVVGFPFDRYLSRFVQLYLGDTVNCGLFEGLSHLIQLAE